MTQLDELKSTSKISLVLRGKFLIVISILLHGLSRNASDSTHIPNRKPVRKLSDLPDRFFVSFPIWHRSFPRFLLDASTDASGRFDRVALLLLIFYTRVKIRIRADRVVCPRWPFGGKLPMLGAQQHPKGYCPRAGNSRPLVMLNNGMKTTTISHRTHPGRYSRSFPRCDSSWHYRSLKSALHCTPGAGGRR